MRTLATYAAILAVALPAAGATSGLRGTVTRAPITPVCHAGRPCSAPAKHVKLTFMRLGRTWTTRTDDNGRYRIVLHPGLYTVRSAAMRLFPVHVIVPRGRIAIHDFAIDTGIR